MKLERIVLGVYILCLAGLMCLYGWADTQFKAIQAEKDKVKPHIEKIVEYADDDPVVVKKDPPDVLEETEEEIIEEVEDEIIIPEMVLDANLGRVQGPQEQETYYNLPMEKVIENMRKMGYTEADYPYYVREDGVRMLGDFIMVAADLNKYPKGTVVMTTLGQGIICDKCEHAQELDIAVEW